MIPDPHGVGVGLPAGHHAGHLPKQQPKPKHHLLCCVLALQTLENPKYELIIEAQDMAGQDVGLTGTATATIVIDDKNDHSPKFTNKEVNLC